MRNINIIYMHSNNFMQYIHSFKDQILKLYYQYLYIIQHKYMEVKLKLMVYIKLHLITNLHLI